MSIDFEKYVAKGVVVDLSAVALYTRSDTAAPLLLPYRSHIPNPIIPYRFHTAAPIFRHTVPVPSPYRSNTAPIPSHTALCIAYGVWQGVWLLTVSSTVAYRYGWSIGAVSPILEPYRNFLSRAAELHFALVLHKNVPSAALVLSV